jgi:hypothetical protein
MSEKCTFIKKDGNQCTNKQKEDSVCGIHLKYSKLGVTIENRCSECGKPNDTSNKICSECQVKRSAKAAEKRLKIKEDKMNKEMETLQIEEYEISPYYLSGFFDGDGSICINQGLSLQIQFSQCVLSVLKIIQNIFGGSIYSGNIDVENQRIQHSLRLCGKDCSKILQYLDIGSIMKWEQIQVAKKFINLNNLQNLEAKKIELKEEMKKLNKSYKKTHNKPYEKLNWDYIGGIFDAEGCIYLRNNNDIFKFGYIKITQANDYQLLEHIKNFVGHGKTYDKSKWMTEKIEFALWDLEQIVHMLIVKKYQAELCLEFLKSTDNNRKKEIYYLVKDDKHKMYTLEEQHAQEIDFNM